MSCFFCSFCKFIFFIEVYLIYNVVLMLLYNKVAQLCTHMLDAFSFIFFSIMVYSRILNIVPCSMQ